MNRGLTPLRIDLRDLHFHAEFGSVSMIDLPLNQDHDAGLTFPIQQFADERCTGITVTDIATDQLGIIFSADYNMMRTLQMENLPPTHPGANPRDAFKIPISWGLLPKNLEPVSTERNGSIAALDPFAWPNALNAQASLHRLPAFLRADTGPSDTFDNIRSAIALGAKKTVGIATAWFEEWENETPESGIMLELPKNRISDHMYKVCGPTQYNTHGSFIRGGEVFLKLKSWNSRSWGDNGYGYLSRAAVNRRFGQTFDPSTWGAIALAFDLVDPATIAGLKNQQNELIEILLTMLQNKIIQLTSP